MFSPGAWSSQHGAEQDCADGIWLEVESSWSSWCENYLVTSSASVLFKENEAVLGSKREGLSTALSVLGGWRGRRWFTGGREHAVPDLVFPSLSPSARMNRRLCIVNLGSTVCF